MRATFLLCLMLCAFALSGYCQSDGQRFRDYQYSSDRVASATKKYSDSLKKYFKQKKVLWPATDIYLRAFKNQNELELWARNDDVLEYKLIKTYKVCAVSGDLGPKRQQGDKQVPEGFYFIDDFNPKSDYHLSMRISYPNFSDEMLGKENPGGNIYIHGGCLTVGCLPMDNEGIRELYTVCLKAKLNGQEYIPIHIFPTRMSKKGINFLLTDYADDHEKQQFWAVLKTHYDYFEQHHKLLPVIYTTDGNYLN